MSRIQIKTSGMLMQIKIVVPSSAFGKTKCDRRRATTIKRTIGVLYRANVLY